MKSKTSRASAEGALAKLDTEYFLAKLHGGIKFEQRFVMELVWLHQQRTRIRALLVRRHNSQAQKLARSVRTKLISWERRFALQTSQGSQAQRAQGSTEPLLPTEPGSQATPAADPPQVQVLQKTRPTNPHKLTTRDRRVAATAARPVRRTYQVGGIQICVGLGRQRSR